MPNFFKISRQIKKLSIQTLDSIIQLPCYSCPISAVLANEQLLGEKRTFEKFQINISKNEGLVRILVYTDGQTANSTQLVTLIIYIYIV